MNTETLNPALAIFQSFVNPGAEWSEWVYPTVGDEGRYAVTFSSDTVEIDFRYVDNKLTEVACYGYRDRFNDGPMVAYVFPNRIGFRGTYANKPLGKAMAHEAFRTMVRNVAAKANA